MEHSKLYEQVEIHHEEAGTATATRAALADGLGEKGWREVVRDAVGNVTGLVSHWSPESPAAEDGGEEAAEPGGDESDVLDSKGDDPEPPKAAKRGSDKE